MDTKYSIVERGTASPVGRIEQEMLKLLFAHGWASTPDRMAIAIVVTVSFAVLARILRGVNVSGALAGGLACFLLYAGAGHAAFVALAALFVLTWISTRLGFGRKQELGLAERGEGRSAWQVLANLGVASGCAIAFSVTGNRMWLVALTAALSEAATDTVASEIGQSRSRDAIMITTWKMVPAGTDGGITVVGTLAGTAAGVLIACVAILGGMIGASGVWIAGTSGFTGMLADSLLGATCQRRGWMNNEAVNFFGTLAAAAMAYGIGRLAFGT